MERGTSRDEADAEAQVAAMVAALFLVNRGYASIRQEDGMDGKVILRDLHPEERGLRHSFGAASSPREIGGRLKWIKIPSQLSSKQFCLGQDVR